MALGEINPLKTAQFILQRWWVLVLLGILGGCAGWLVHHFRSPIFEAKAVLALNINFPAFTEETLSIYVADQTFGAGGVLMFSSTVLEQVVQEAQRRGIDVDQAGFGKMIQYPERRQNLWTLRVRNSDPQLATDLANIWGEVSYRALDEAHAHAVRAWVLRAYLQALGECPDPPEIDPPPPPICSGQGGIDRQNLSDIEAEYNAESQASKGILPDLLYDFSQRAQVPDEPLAFDTGWLVLSGALIGLLCGMLLLTLPVAAMSSQPSKGQAGKQTHVS